MAVLPLANSEQSNGKRLVDWPLEKLIVAVLTAGFAFLVIDLRSEHVDVVRHHWTAWIPIYYSAVMVLDGILGLAFWQRGGRLVLLAGFVLSFVVGTLGFWFHNEGHIVRSVVEVFAAWTKPAHHDDVPPPLAPLAFIGLGLLGALACGRRVK